MFIEIYIQFTGRSREFSGRNLKIKCNKLSLSSLGVFSAQFSTFDGINFHITLQFFAVKVLDYQAFRIIGLLLWIKEMLMYILYVIYHDL